MMAAPGRVEMQQSLDQLRLLYDIAKAISGATLDIHQTLDTIASYLVNVIDIGSCVIWLTTSETTLQVGAIKGKDYGGIGSLTLPVDASVSFVTRALLGREEQWLKEDQDVLTPFLDHHTALALPMVNDDWPVGVVMIVGERPAGSFDPSTMSLLRAASEQAAIALENAHLYSTLIQFNQELESKVRQRTAELEEANRELERLNRELEHLDRTKSDFISIAAHELKTPLTLIQGYTNIIREHEAIQGHTFLMNALDGIVRGSSRLQGIVESMIDVTLIDSQVLQLRPTLTSIGHLVRTAVKQYGDDLRKRRLTLTVGDLSTLPYVEADGQRLYQVFDNLIVNAIKYTPDGGKIGIDGWTLGVQGETEWVEVVVSDTGIGIDAEHHERIFEKFYRTGEVALHSSGRTKFKGGGPGLGLAIVKGIVQAHGGRIWVESPRHDEEVCPGSQFHLVLPVKSTVRLPQGLHSIHDHSFT